MHVHNRWLYQAGLGQRAAVRRMHGDPMRALVHDPDAPDGLRLGEAPDPEPGPAEALVQVDAISLNFGELAFLRDRVSARRGARLGRRRDGARRGRRRHRPAAGHPRRDVRLVRRLGAAARRRHRPSSPSCPMRSTFGAAAASRSPASPRCARCAARPGGRPQGADHRRVGRRRPLRRSARRARRRPCRRRAAAPSAVEGLAELGAAEVLAASATCASPLTARSTTSAATCWPTRTRCCDRAATSLSVGMASLEPTTIDFEAQRMRAADSGSRRSTSAGGSATTLRTCSAARRRRARPADRLARRRGTAQPRPPTR